MPNVRGLLKGRKAAAGGREGDTTPSVRVLPMPAATHLQVGVVAPKQADGGPVVRPRSRLLRVKVAHAHARLAKRSHLRPRRGGMAEVQHATTVGGDIREVQQPKGGAGRRRSPPPSWASQPASLPAGPCHSTDPTPHPHPPTPHPTHLDLHPPLGLLAIVRHPPEAGLVQPAAAHAVRRAALAVVAVGAGAVRDGQVDRGGSCGGGRGHGRWQEVSGRRAHGRRQAQADAPPQRSPATRSSGSLPAQPASTLTPSAALLIAASAPGCTTPGLTHQSARKRAPPAPA